MFSGINSWPFADASPMEGLDVKEEMGPEVPPKGPNSSSETTHPAKSEIKAESKDNLLEDSQKHSAVEIEVALLTPQWLKTIRLENHDANEDQLQTLLDIKLTEIRNLIPVRTKIEQKFKYDCQILRQSQANLTQLLALLRAKEPNDPSVRIEDFQAQLVIKDWESVRMAKFEEDYQNVAKVWYKPYEDPLIQEFSSIMNKFASLIAQFEYERSIRGLANQDGGLNHVIVSNSRTIQPSNARNHSEVLMRIEPFDGDLSDPKVLVKFAKWKRSWFALVRQLEQQPLFNHDMLYKALKESLSGPALASVSQYTPDTVDLYQTAFKNLTQKYEDPIQLASYCIRNGTQFKKTEGEKVEAIQQSLGALHNMRNAFENEKVDMFNFSLIASFVSVMCPKLQTRWEEFKCDQKKRYMEKREVALREGKDMPPWNAGMAESAETFNAWLDLESAKDPHNRKSSPSPVNVESAFKKKTCVVCGPDGQDHILSQCPKALGMNRLQWRGICRRLSICFKCAGSFHTRHKCDIKCRNCRDKPNDMDHNILMCPMNKYRTAPLEK